MGLRAARCLKDDTVNLALRIAVTHLSHGLGRALPARTQAGGAPNMCLGHWPSRAGSAGWGQPGGKLLDRQAAWSGDR